MPNRLQYQTSPYLLQHANNPVDWQPWDEQSLKQAKTEDKPILLSIGYAACHWCHVMERESFENPQIAQIMNNLFICIKVDREERPDLDKIYQLAHQMLTERPGGWPLTLALTANGHAPYFAGTYFPPESRYNMPGFGDLLNKISDHYVHNKTKLGNYHLSFNQALERLNPLPDKSRIPDSVSTLMSAVESLEKQFDQTFGGLGDAPKFPHPSQLNLFITGSFLSDSKLAGSCSSMLQLTLSNMANGGLFDQLGGGFFRYSVDRKWQIPHFEKMLYDNAQLLSIYCDAFQLFGKGQYSQAIDSTANWVIREMQSDTGGYYSTIDADSEGEEGKFYVWSETDLRAVLSESQYTLLENHFALYGEENFEGNWHFSINPETDHELLAENPELKKSIEQIKTRLFNLREARIRPSLDDKILTSWNGLMIKGMAKSARILAGRSLQSDKFIDSAQRAADFVRNNMWQGNRLMAACNAGKARLNGYLDDYAFMLNGLLELLQCRWRILDLDFCILLADAMLDKFEDKTHGGFFFTSHDHEILLYRAKTGADDAIPSGNAVAIEGLLKLGTLLGESRYLDAANNALTLFANALNHQPSINAAMVSALQLTHEQHATIIIRGKQSEIGQWSDYCHNRYRKQINVYALDQNQKSLPKGLSFKKPGKNTVAYICNGMTCLPAITSFDDFKIYIDSC